MAQTIDPTPLSVPDREDVAIRDTSSAPRPASGPRRHRVVVVGGGFAGLRAVRGLRARRST